MKRHRLLVVDGDPRSLRVLDVSLRGAGFEVETASNGAEAWSKLETAPPDLVIADAELQGEPEREGQVGQMDGFELCARLRASAGGATIPFILLGADQSLQQRIRGLECGADDYLPKPAYVKEVLSRVRARLLHRDRDRLTSVAAESGDAVGGKGPPNSPFSGDLADITVVDLVQLVEGKGGSGIIHLRGEAGTGGAIYVRQGKVVDAEVGQLSGMDALSRLFAWVGGTFELEWKTIRRKDVIERPPAELVIEGMQKLDDGNRLRQAFPDARVVFAVDYPVLSARLSEIPDEMNNVLRLCNGMRTLEQILVDCPLADVDALTALIRLREEGIILVAAHSDAETAHGHTGNADRRDRPRLVDATNAEEGNRRDIAAQSGATPWRTSEDDLQLPKPSRRRTAPGLGQAISLSTSARDSPPSVPDFVATAVAAAGAEQPPHNVIRFPLPGGELSSAPQDGAQQPVSGLIDAPSRSADDSSASAPTPYADPPKDAVDDETAQAESILFPPPELSVHQVPRPSGAMSRTQRGFGRGLVSDVESSDSAVPVAVVDRRSGGSRESGGQYETSSKVPEGATGAVRGGGSGQNAGSGETGAGERDSASSRTEDGAPGARQGDGLATGRAIVPTVELSPELSAQSIGPSAARDQAAVSRRVDDRSGSHRGKGRVVAPSAAADATERIRYRDDHISDHEARDELGVASNWRGLRFLAITLVVGGLAAVVTHRFRGVRHDEGGNKPAVAAAEPGGAIAANGSEPTDDTPVPAPAPAPVLPGGADTARPTSVPPAAAAPPPTGRSPAADQKLSRPAEQAAGEPSLAANPPDGPAGRGRPPATPPVIVAATRPPETAPKANNPQQLSTAPPSATGSPSRVQTAATPSQPLAICRAAFAKGRIKEALSACGDAVAANPRSAEALTMLAHSELNRGNLSRAGDLARKALAIDPNMADAYVIAGGVHQDSGQNGQAKAAYRRYLQLSPHGRYADELRSIVNSL